MWWYRLNKHKAIQPQFKGGWKPPWRHPWTWHPSWLACQLLWSRLQNSMSADKLEISLTTNAPAVSLLEVKQENNQRSIPLHKKVLDPHREPLSSSPRKLKFPPWCWNQNQLTSRNPHMILRSYLSFLFQPCLACYSWSSTRLLQYASFLAKAFKGNNHHIWYP